MNIASTSGSASSIDTLVAQYMAIERKPITRLQTDQASLTTRSGLFSDLKGKLAPLEDLANEIMDTEASVFDTRTASSDEETEITATAEQGAAVGTYLFRVKQLATATTMKSTAGLNTAPSVTSSAQVVTGSETIDPSERFDEAGFQNTITGNITINTGGGAVTFDPADYDSVNAFMTAINDDATAGATIYYNDMNDRFIIEADDPSASLTLSQSGNLLTEINIAPGVYSTNTTGLQTDVLLYKENFDSEVGENDSGSFKINGVEIEWDADEDTLGEVISRINGSSAGVTAFYEDTLDRIFLSSNSTGSENIALEDISGTLLSQTLKLDSGVQTQGLDAKFTINSTDSADEITKSSNTFEINGVSITLKATNSTDYTESTYTTVTVEEDQNAITSKIEDFLSKFNTVTDYIKAQSAVTENSGGAYTRGALAGQSTYTSLRMNLINAMTEEVTGLTSGDPNYLSGIGITFDNDLHVSISDSDLFSEALSDDPSAVEALFNSTDGVATKISALLEPFTEDDGIIEATQEVISDQIARSEDQVDRLEDRMTRREAQLRSQFASMQQALNLIMMQQSFMQTILGAMNQTLYSD
ncbi:MAG: flagellar filament capping protein FliD [Candidatus Latescibacteria bacterium]|nr:flagellar filament capping protein FliD [Candidatus Latescibacterota bacterium]